MISTIYVESEVREHPRVTRICSRFPRARVVECRRYTEIFNRKNQNFRLQKEQPALILAAKHGQQVLPAPLIYSIGGKNNFYFSHMFNCLYDCRYCFLQGMFQSAHYVVFVTYERFAEVIGSTAAKYDESYFFSGYDCDSLAFEPITGFVEFLLPKFAAMPNAWLELRTKSTQIRNLLSTTPLPNVVIAFSLAPECVADAVEYRAPGLSRRLQAIQRLQQQGWAVGLRFDPLILTDDFEQVYEQFFSEVFNNVQPGLIHSVTFGSFRMPRDFYKKLVKLYPAEPLFAGPLEEIDGNITYQAVYGEKLLDWCERQLNRYIDADYLFRQQTYRVDANAGSVQAGI